MTRLARLLGAVALVAAFAARVDARAHARGVLHEPHAGERLRGGTRATVSWSAERLPAYAEEWEAFLSVDGGEYYAYRITPHLDAAQRTFTFEVPNVATQHARILIRAGDERREVELELPATFTIERDEARALTAPSVEVDDDERGEAAREGDRGVVAWIDGDRDGHHLAPRNALRRAAAIRCAQHFQDTPDSAEAAAARTITPRGETSGTTRFAPSFLAPRETPRHRTGRDVLLAYRRLNI